MYVFEVYSNHTVCQMPVERVYQISCGVAVQSCLPRGRSLRLGKSSARTHDFEFTRLRHGVRDLTVERSVTTGVGTDHIPVDPHTGRPINGTEVKDDPLVGGTISRQLPRPPVPAPAEISRELHAAQRRFGAEGNHDRPIEFHFRGVFPSGVGIHGKVPRPVQTLPRRAPEKRPRKLFVSHQECLSPGWMFTTSSCLAGAQETGGHRWDRTSDGPRSTPSDERWLFGALLGSGRIGQSDVMDELEEHTWARTKSTLMLPGAVTPTASRRSASASPVRAIPVTCACGRRAIATSAD